MPPKEKPTRSQRQRVYIPKKTTLKKYGLTLTDYREMKADQDKLCPVCEKTPKNEKFVIDHEHVPGWAKLPQKERKKYVRGLLCFFCNRYYLARNITARKAENVASYLRNYQTRNS